MYLNNNDKSKCSGCTACMNICHRNAIEMIEDEEGFKYPVIDKKKCVNCGACVRICPNIKQDKSNTIIKVYGAKHKNEKERTTSRSGAVFVALSDWILKENGIIYGVRQGKDFSAVHDRATNKEKRDLFKGSKYIQSNMNDTIAKVKEDLREGKKVLFTGTPCQVAGVKACIDKKSKENLYTCDIICHGVPSEKIFKEFLKYIEKENKKKIKGFNFRDKKYGWENHYETSIFEDDTEVTTQYFRNLFYGHNILRPSCHKCNYANINRPADITIADFWGIENINPEFKDSKGVSLVIINNEKGEQLFEKVKKDLNIIECSIENCIKYTYTLTQATQESEDRKKFWEDYKNQEFEYIITEYASDKNAS